MIIIKLIDQTLFGFFDPTIFLESSHHIISRRLPGDSLDNGCKNICDSLLDILCYCFAEFSLCSISKCGVPALNAATG